MPASNSNPPADRAEKQGRGDERTETAAAKPLRLFEAYGIEVEYMLVDAETLDVAPSADELFEAAAGEVTDELENGDVAWNNELALHVIEFKCNGPRPSLSGLGEAFGANVRDARELEARAPRAPPDAHRHASVDGSRRRRALAARYACDLRDLRPDLLLQGPRLGESAKHADQFAVLRRRRV